MQTMRVVSLRDGKNAGHAHGRDQGEQGDVVVGEEAHFKLAAGVEKVDNDELRFEYMKAG
jgi:hypothetical protein